jgi:hypothetical protein
MNHPAKFPAKVLEIFQAHVDEQSEPPTVLDPFAGVGGIHSLTGCKATAGIELEIEWAAMHPNTACGDSAELLLAVPDDSIDMIATSPAYGNRFADQYIPKDTDTSKRFTYAVSLGRKLTQGSGAAKSFGPKYCEIHSAVWTQCARVLKPGGSLLLNIKNFYKGGEVVDVTAWHLAELRSLGLSVVEIHDTDLDGIQFSPNRDRCSEQIFVLKSLSGTEA